MKIFRLSLLAKPHEKAVHLHALETLKVVIGVTTPAQANGYVDQENNTLNGKTNGHITSKPEVQKALTNGAFEWQEGSGSEAVSPVTTETTDGGTPDENKEEVIQQ